MPQYTVNFKVTVTEENTEKVKDWIRFQVGETGSLSLDNPLVDIDLKATFGTVCVWKD